MSPLNWVDSEKLYMIGYENIMRKHLELDRGQAGPWPQNTHLDLFVKKLKVSAFKLMCILHLLWLECLRSSTLFLHKDHHLLHDTYTSLQIMSCMTTCTFFFFFFFFGGGGGGGGGGGLSHSHFLWYSCFVIA